MANTIEILGGCAASTTRMVLKREMEQFGAVAVCHMGNRERAAEEPPWVRFVDGRGCDGALAAIERGEVVVDGIVLRAQRSQRRGPPLVSRELQRDERGSRELFMQRSKQRSKQRSRSRRRRSRSRRR